MKTHPDYVYRQPKKEYRCLSCCKVLSGYRSRHCVKCQNKGILNPNFGKKRPQHSKMMSGKNNPNYGKRYDNLHSTEFKKKMSIRMSGEGNTMYGVRLLGKKNPNYQNGLSKDPYPLEFNIILKEKLES